MATILRKTAAESAAPCCAFLASALAFSVGWWWLAFPTLFAGCVLAGEALHRIMSEDTD